MAAKFHFTLERILQLRQALENNRAVQLEESNQKLSRELNSLDTIKAEKEKQLNRRGTENGQLNLFNLAVSGSYLESLNDGLEEQAIQVDKSRKNVDKKRADLLQASRDKKVLETLKNNRYDEYKHDVKKKELLLSSEIALRLGMNK